MYTLWVALDMRRHNVVVQPSHLAAVLRRLELEVREEHRQRDLWRTQRPKEKSKPANFHLQLR